jgi:hypothetical protein
MNVPCQSYGTCGLTVTSARSITFWKEMLQAYSRGPDAFSSSTPDILAKLVWEMLNFTFVSETMDDVKSGLQPFIVAVGTSEQRQANLQVSCLYGLLNYGEHFVMLADLELLKSKEIQAVPLNYFKLEQNIGMFGNLLGVVLGSQHVMTTKYREFRNLLNQGHCNEVQQIIGVKQFTKAAIKPTHILHSVQLICFNWFTKKKHGLRPAAPKFTPILSNKGLLQGLQEGFRKLRRRHITNVWHHPSHPSLANTRPHPTEYQNHQRQPGYVLGQHIPCNHYHPHPDGYYDAIHYGRQHSSLSVLSFTSHLLVQLSARCQSWAHSIFSGTNPP